MSTNGDGLWLQQMQVSDIASVGSPVTLGDGVTQKPAMVLTTVREIQKYVVLDGDQEGRGKVVIVFVFDGTVYGSIKNGDALTFMGVRYIAQTPLYPNFVQGVCVDFAVACYAP